MKRTRNTIKLAACFLLVPWLQAPATSLPAQQKTQDQAIRVQVEMVSLPVVVTTKDGRRVTDLVKEDFQVFENGVAQKISGFAATDEPISVVLLLDTSGSTEQRLARIQNEAIRFCWRLHPDDSLAVLSFAEDVKLQGDFSMDRRRNERAIKMTRPGGHTVLFEAVWLALEEVLKPVTERNALVLFTDGVDTASSKVSRKETLEISKETRATIYSIYFNTQWDRTGGRPTIGGYPVPSGPPIVVSPMPPGYPPAGYPFPGPGSSGAEYAAGRRYLSELAENSGGMVFDALVMDDLGPAFEQIARELASQYSIGYYSTNQKRDGIFRKVEVKVNKPGLVARTKKGYYAPKPPK